MIRVYDKFGRELFVSREQWRDNVLFGTLRKEWDNPDGLYAVIVQALNDGFRADVVETAEHLYTIDPVRSRGACLWGVILTEEGRLDDAERVFRDYLAAHGDEGYILANLAKVHAKRGNHALADETFWRALEVDPNQENGLACYTSIHRDRGGELGQREALQRVAAVPTSWRAQLWLARAALEAGEWEDALGHYRQALSRAGRPCPIDLLMQMSGDLGQHGQLVALLKLTTPHFDAAVHGLYVGNNLIKAHVDLDELTEAKDLVERLYKQDRPDWLPTLRYWESEIAKKRLTTAAPVKAESARVTMLTIDGPIWLPTGSPAAALFPGAGGGGGADLEDEIPNIRFLGSTAGVDHEGHEGREGIAVREVPDTPGRLSRALPLFLCERTYLASRARCQALIPFVIAPHPGLVLSGAEWAPDEASHVAREGDNPADYVVVTHLLAIGKPWHARMRLIRTIDAACLEEWEQPFDVGQPKAGFESLASELRDGMRRHAGAEAIPPQAEYRTPDGAHFANYLLRLEQLLAVRAANINGISKEFLAGEREIIAGNLQLCLDYPKLVTTRVLLMQTLAYMHRIRPAVVEEVREKIAYLQKEHPLSGDADLIVRQIAGETIGPRSSDGPSSP